jgi:predicted neuraminidase
MANNDTESGRARLSVWRSTDEGRTWPERRPIEDTAGGSFSYPSVIQTADGLVHVSYSYVEPAGAAAGRRREAIRHVVLDPAWVAMAPRDRQSQGKD